MEQAKIDRINALARKSNTEGLTPLEREEQRLLREEYIALFRQNMRRQLDAIVYVDEEGNEVQLTRRTQVTRIRLEHLN